MVRRRNPPSQPWKTFLRNHAEAIAAINMCVVPTLSFDLLFVFLVLGHGRRRLLWFEVTRHPTAEWLARQITEALCKAHLDPLPLVTRSGERLCLHLPASHIAGIFVQIARNLARRVSGAAPRSQRTGIAVSFRGGHC
jgi:hypothetical protein